jgi:PIN domain nuclease of toxin-antitoxin system
VGAVTLLLDTHALLWAVADPNALSERARALLLDGRNTIVVSSVSAWEIATKHRLGRLPEAEVILASFPQHLQELGAEELAISVRHALTAGAFPSQHRDPFDRMLAAQALHEGLPLLTADGLFAEFPVETIW